MVQFLLLGWCWRLKSVLLENKKDEQGRSGNGVVGAGSILMGFAMIHAEREFCFHYMPFDLVL
jgi:hypothetical protein